MAKGEQAEGPAQKRPCHGIIISPGAQKNSRCCGDSSALAASSHKIG